MRIDKEKATIEEGSIYLLLGHPVEKTGFNSKKKGNT